MPLDPQLRPLIDAMESDPNTKLTHEQSPTEARESYRAFSAMFGPGEEVGRVENRTIPGPAAKIPLRIYAPEGDGPFGVLVFFHGGGFVIGDLETHDKECRALCNRANCVVVAVDYRLAPEHPFPAAPDDCFAALEWVGAHAGEFHGDPSRLAVGGDSAGGNLATVVALMARDRGGPALRFQLLVYPGVDARENDLYKSRDQNAAGPLLPSETMTYFMDHYVRGSSDGDASRENMLASPILAPSLKGLPPALVITAELDVLRDEGEAYARALEAAGVLTGLRRYDGQPHAFLQLAPMVDAGKLALDEAGAALRKHLA
ncbi:MAG: alpha/beta hydrolase [Deltaproteobacteria bacterium]|nr:alpha/beta hydrolase [Deltaproteobacteria bacterium]